MAVMIFSLPMVALAQESGSGEGQDQLSVLALARADAERDAQADTRKAGWFACGFVGGCLAPLFAYVYDGTSPPPSRLLGKSPEYIVLYTDAYRSKTRNVRLRYAAMGCVVASVTSCVTNLVIASLDE